MQDTLRDDFAFLKRADPLVFSTAPHQSKPQAVVEQPVLITRRRLQRASGAYRLSAQATALMSKPARMWPNLSVP